MVNLDLISEIKKLDSTNILGSIQAMPDQVEQAITEVKNIFIPDSYKTSSRVVIAGMGGSALGGRIIDSLGFDRLTVPLEINTEMRLPYYIDHNTLVVLSSYSGDTEETLVVASEALRKKSHIFGITTGGRLSEFLKSNNLPSYIFNPINNPSNLPRMGLGYAVGALASLLKNLGFINLGDEDLKDAITTSKKCVSEFDVSVPEDKNLAKLHARKLFGKIPVLVASEHLVGTAHAVKNQLNENAKTFALLFDLPELHHHLLEALRNPAQAKAFLSFVFFSSPLYGEDIIKRYPITEEVVARNEVNSIIYHTQSAKKIQDVFEVLVFGSYLGFYLSILYGVDPGPIPWVDYFKKRFSSFN